MSSSVLGVADLDRLPVVNSVHRGACFPVVGSSVQLVAKHFRFRLQCDIFATGSHCNKILNETVVSNLRKVGETRVFVTMPGKNLSPNEKEAGLRSSPCLGSAQVAPPQEDCPEESGDQRPENPPKQPAFVWPGLGEEHSTPSQKRLQPSLQAPRKETDVDSGHEGQEV